MARRRTIKMSQDDLNSEALRLTTKYQAAVIKEYLMANTGWRVSSIKPHYYDNTNYSYVVFMRNENTVIGVLNDGSKHIDTGGISISHALFVIAQKNYDKLTAQENPTFCVKEDGTI